MRKSILVTAAIAVIAGGLAFAFSQTEQGKNLFGTTDEATTSEVIASAANDAGDTETAYIEVVEEDTAATDPNAPPPGTVIEEGVVEIAGEKDDVPPGAEAGPSIAVPQSADTPVNTASAGMTPVDLDNLPTSADADAVDPDAGKTPEEAALPPTRDPGAAEQSAAKNSEAERLEKAAADIKIDVAAALKDREIGAANAPVTVYDFSSLTCPHCAHFHNEVLPKIKKDYIDTGKVRWVFRGFPLNEPALKGEMIARCAPRDQYEKLQDLMYQNQERWAFEENPLANLNMLLRLAGISDEMFLACVNNTELQAALLEKYQKDGEKFDINSTPTFVFNDGQKKFSGAGTYEGFSFDLDAMLRQAGK